MATLEQDRQFLGRGITYPFNVVGGSIPTTTGIELIQTNVRGVLEYNFGTRFFLGEFGARVRSLLEEPNDILLQTLLGNYVRQALLDWEPRIELISISIQERSVEAIQANLSYRVRYNNSEQSFTFPFYRGII